MPAAAGRAARSGLAGFSASPPCLAWGVGETWGVGGRAGALRRAQRAGAPLVRRAPEGRPRRGGLPAALAGTVPESGGGDGGDGAGGGGAGRWRLPVVLRVEGIFRPNSQDAAIAALALPALAAVAFEPFMSLVDTAIVARLGTAPLAGVGLSGLFFTISTFLFSFLVSAVTPAVGKAHARGDEVAVSRTVACGLILAGGMGALALVGLVAAGPWGLVHVMRAGPDVLPFAKAYFWGRLWALPLALMQFVCMGAFRGVGDTRTPLAATALGSAVNVTLDVAFVFGLGWGVFGAAVASSLAQAASLALLLALLAHRGHLRPNDLRELPRAKEMAPVLLAGAALSTRSMASMAAVTFATSSVAVLGAAPLAAHEILRQVFMLGAMAVEPLGISAQALVSRARGRGDLEGALQVANRLLQLALCTGCCSGLVVVLFAPLYSAQVSADAAVVALTHLTIPLLAFFQPVEAVMAVSDHVLYGADDHPAVARGMVVAAALCVSALACVKRSNYNLLTVWACLKVLSSGRFVNNVRRLTSKSSPLLQPLQA